MLTDGVWRASLVGAHLEELGGGTHGKNMRLSPSHMPHAMHLFLWLFLSCVLCNNGVIVSKKALS